MIKHIVLFRFTEKMTAEERNKKAESLQSIFQPLEELESVKEYRVGINISCSDFAWDVVIDSVFDSPESLKRYSISDEHRDAILRARQFEKEKSVIDYEF